MNAGFRLTLFGAAVASSNVIALLVTVLGVILVEGPRANIDAPLLLGMISTMLVGAALAIAGAAAS